MALQVACEQFITSDDLTCNCDDVAVDVLNDTIDQASDAIAVMTGGLIVGQCEETVRPRRAQSSVCGCSELWNCTCGPLHGVTLRGPSPEIQEILIDGSPFVDWVIVDGNLLVRSDGMNWPGCQDVTKEATEDGTFQITYLYNDPIPQLAQLAAAEIVCSFLKNPPQEPRKTHPQARGMSIAGVQITLDQQILEIKRRTMLLPYVVRLLTIYAPDGAAPAVVYSPELEDGWKLHRVDAIGS